MRHLPKIAKVSREVEKDVKKAIRETGVST